MTPRRACKKDLSHDLIADAFRKLGWQWYDTYQFAQYHPGWPDGEAVRWPVVLKVEVKSEKGQLTPDEQAFWNTYEGPKCICRTIEDVLVAHTEWGNKEMIEEE